jgi:Clp amino terminal domain, pathogenicity island component
MEDPLAQCAGRSREDRRGCGSRDDRRAHLAAGLLSEPDGLRSGEPWPPLKLRHNYIRAEHLLLGILDAERDAAGILIGLGLTTARTKRLLGEEFARIQAERNTAG